MKKSLALLAILAIAATSFAQESAKKIDTAAVMKKTYNAHGGMNFSSLSMRYGTYGKYRSNSALGFHAGATMDMPLAIIDIASDAYLVSVHPGAQFVKKGGKRSILSLLSGFKYEISAYYLEAPVLFSVKKTFSETLAVRADLGPYLALGLFGEQEYGYGSYYESESSFTENGLSRLDGGMYYGATMDFAKKYSIGFHAGSGFTDDNIYTIYITWATGFNQ